MRDLAVVYRAIGELKAHSGNPRTHSPKQIRQIAGSIRHFGFTNPILIDAGDRIIAGHGRIEAAKLLGLKTVPTIRLEHLTEAQKRAYVIADNRLAELAGWDRELLALELQYLSALDLDFDATITGFETPEIDLLIQGFAPAEDDPAADALPDEDPEAPPVNVEGDLWLLGPHRLLCADATKDVSFARLLGNEKAQMVFIDPPYNVPIDGHVCGSGAIKHAEFIMASGEMSEAEFTAFLKASFEQLARHSADGSIHFVCMDWRHLYEVLSAGRLVYSELKNLCVWNKDNGGMGSFYRSKHELVLVFKSGTAPHLNNFGLGEHGRYRTNVWDYPGVNSLREGRLEELRGQLYHLLANPVYIGVIAHKRISYPGQHESIIDRETFDAVQRRLADNTAARRSATNAKAPSLLTGLVFDEAGDRLCPTHANKKGRRYRYYISKRLMQRTGSVKDGWRLPANELEGAVVQTVTDFLRDEFRLVDVLQLASMAPMHLRSILDHASAAADELKDGPPERRRELLHLLLYRVTLHTESIRIELRRSELNTLVANHHPDSDVHPDRLIELTIPILLRRRGVEAKLVMRAKQEQAPTPDRYLVSLLARAHRWFDQLTRGEIQSVREIACREGIDPSDVGHDIQLAFLAPDIIEDILTGRQPIELTARRLRRFGALPMEWERQRRLLGFAV